jgi:hypothetical protein
MANGQWPMPNGKWSWALDEGAEMGVSSPKHHEHSAFATGHLALTGTPDDFSRTYSQ